MSKKSKICCSSIDDTVLSIALEQTSIAHILNAEGEKIQKGIATAVCVGELLCLNKSVQNTIIDVTNLEIVLYNKLSKALCCDCCDCVPLVCEKGEVVVHVSMCCTKEPFMNAVIQVYFCNQTQLIAEGKTDSNGQFCVKELQNGKYDIAAINPMTAEKIVAKFCIDDNQKHCIKRICFEKSTVKKIKISGMVVDSCGNCLSKALVIANGLTEKRVQTDNLGNFEIEDLSVLDAFSLFATYGGKASEKSKRIHLVHEDYFFSVKIII